VRDRQQIHEFVNSTTSNESISGFGKARQTGFSALSPFFLHIKQMGGPDPNVRSFILDFGERTAAQAGENA
jgi:hypothetical protein